MVSPICTRADFVTWVLRTSIANHRSCCSVGITGSSSASSSATPSARASSTAATATASSNVSPDGTCGEDYSNYNCEGSQFGDCCSQYGYCGSTSDYCGRVVRPASEHVLRSKFPRAPYRNGKRDMVLQSPEAMEGMSVVKSHAARTHGASKKLDRRRGKYKIITINSAGPLCVILYRVFQSSLFAKKQ